MSNDNEQMDGVAQYEQNIHTLFDIWRKAFAKHNSTPVLMLGVLPNGQPHLIAVENLTNSQVESLVAAALHLIQGKEVDKQS